MTSEYLLARFPFLAGQRGWEKFASQFDKAECVVKWAKAREVHEGAEPSPEVRKLRQRCSHIINQAFWGKWGNGKEDKWSGFLKGKIDYIQSRRRFVSGNPSSKPYPEPENPAARKTASTTRPCVPAPPREPPISRSGVSSRATQSRRNNGRTCLRRDRPKPSSVPSAMKAPA